VKRKVKNVGGKGVAMEFVGGVGSIWIEKVVVVLLGENSERVVEMYVVFGL